MKTLYLIKEKEETKKFAGIVSGENIEIDNDKKEVKLYTNNEITAIIDFYRIIQKSKNYYYNCYHYKNCLDDFFPSMSLSLRLSYQIY